MSDKKTHTCSFEIVSPMSPMKVRIVDSEGVAHEGTFSINVADVEENLDKPKDGNERFTYDLRWAVSKIRRVAFMLALLLLGSVAHAKPIKEKSLMTEEQISEIVTTASKIAFAATHRAIPTPSVNGGNGGMVITSDNDTVQMARYDVLFAAALTGLLAAHGGGAK